MIDLQGLPLPDDAPPPHTCVRIERPEAGLAVLVLDPPHRTGPVLDVPMLRDLDLALGEIERDATVRGLVITGRDPLTFAYGADLDALAAIEDPALVERVVELGHHVFGRLARLPRVRTVAAVGGPVPGGAYELALACGRIVAADHEKTKIGLPETQLGIVPAWGGVHRLPRRVGVVTALEVILKGRLYDARRAARMGLVDRLTPPGYLARVAADLALGRQRLERKSHALRTWLVDKNPLAAALIARRARAEVMRQTKGRYPAPLEAIELVTRAPRVPLPEGAKLEAEAAGRLATGPVARSLISIFRASEAAKKAAEAPDGSKPEPFERAGVVGAGVMGGAIGSLLAERGIATRLAELDAETLDRALAEHQREIGKKRARRRLGPHEANAALDRLDGIAGPAGEASLGRSEVVIEAVAERLDVKRAVFGDLAARVPADCLLATNTSSLSVGAIAEGLPRPERVVGIHFFNPVRKMPLVEIVRARETSDEVVRRAAALALRLGKTPVVVADVAGFLVNRILGPYLDEAVRLFEQGVDAGQIDRALEDFGMPMGPLRLLDEVGFDIAQHAAQSLHEAYGERMTPSQGLGRLIEAGRFGRKSKRGFYEHDGGKAQLAGDLARFQSQGSAGERPAHELVDRCLLPMVTEAVRCLEEEVVASARELDLATVYGFGFAPFRGGLLRWADARGAEALRARLVELAAAPDVRARPAGPARFAVPAPLERAASEGTRFHD